MIDFNHRIREGDISKVVNPLIETALRSAPEDQRNYLGASSLGEDCARKIQYQYMRVPSDKPKYKLETYGIFAVGKFLETLAIENLRAAGFVIFTHDLAGNQFGYSDADGRIQGHVDGIIVSAPIPIKTPAIFEHKALGERSWKKLKKDQLSISFPNYAAQLASYQIHMDPQFPGVGYNPGYFMATHRDTQEKIHDLIPPDTALAQKASDRGVQILKASDARELMPRVAASPDFYKCKMCSWSKTCWEARS